MTGAVSGMTAVACTYPLDIMRAQKSGLIGAKYDNYSLTGIVQHIIRRDGIRGLYRGCGTTLFSSAPYEGLKLGVYPLFKEVFNRHFADKDGTLPIVYKLISGALAGITCGSVTYPLDTTRRNLQMHGLKGAAQYGTPMACIKGLYAEGGLPRFYRGFHVNAVRVVPNTAIMFGAYEKLKEIAML